MLKGSVSTSNVQVGTAAVGEAFKRETELPRSLRSPQVEGGYLDSTRPPTKKR